MPVFGTLSAMPIALELARTSDRNTLVDVQALAAGAADDGLKLCRDGLCSFGTWKKLELGQTLDYARREYREGAVQEAFLVLAMDPAGLDGSGLDASIIEAAKKLKQPPAVLSVESDPPPAPIADVVRSNEGDIHRCVAELDLRRVIRADEWRFEVTVDGSGTVAEFVGYGDIERGNAHRCLDKVFHAMRFAPPSQPITIHYLLTLGDETDNDTGYLRDQPGRRVFILHGTPNLRMGQTQVTGALPREVIQRIVRQSFGRFRLCYEQGLRNNPALQGRIITRFTIDQESDVKVSDAGSDLPDRSVIGCVQRGFENLSFPKPDKGTVTVLFPIVLSPGE
jgi:hypothetical protein